MFLIALAKKNIPHSCRISGTFFNHMTFLGKLEHQNASKIDLHKDEEDIITAILHVGKPMAGGGTKYFSGESKEEPGKLMQNICFQHGRLQIGFFNEVLHGTENWVGCRGGINFNLKKNVLKFFCNDELSKFYTKYEKDGYIDKNYIAV